MPTNPEHALTGGIVGFLCYLGNCGVSNSKPSLGGAITSSVIGGIGGMLPDLIEPPTNPNHRRFFHSASLGSLMTYLLKNIADSTTTSQDAKLISAILGLSYLSHLAEDSITDKGIPLI